MDLLHAIEHAKGGLNTALIDLQDARDLVAALEQDVKEMKLEIVGLESYAKRQGLTAVPEPGADVVPISADVDLNPNDGPDLYLMSRSEAVLTAMGQLPGPADRSAIHVVLADAGRDDSIDDVSLTLSGLKRSGRTEKLGRGLWQLPDGPTAASGN